METKTTITDKARSLFDGLTNLVSGLGTNRDRAQQSSFRVNFGRNYEEWESVYAEEGLGRKLVDIIPGDMLREWRQFEDKARDEDELKKIAKMERKLNYHKTLSDALCWARLYGGAGIIPVLSGQPDYSKPFNPAMVAKGRLLRFAVVDARQLNPTTSGSLDPLSEDYLNPSHYTTASGAGKLIHRSWIYRLHGVKLPQQLLQTNNYWGLSVIENVKRELKNAVATSAETAQLFGEQNMDIVSVKGLAAAMSAGQEEQVKKRFEGYAELKSLFRLIVVDSEETFSNRNFSMSGVDNVMTTMYTIVAGAADIPVTRFLGTSASGLNATGEGDIRNYYDNIRARQENELRPILDWMDRFSMKSAGLESGTLEYNFPPLWQESDTEKEARLFSRAQRDSLYLQNGIVTEGQVLRELVADKVYSFVPEEYVEALEEIGSEVSSDEDLQKVTE